MKENIRLIKLENGEELIGNIIASKSKSTMIVSNPMIVQEVYGSDGKGQIVLSNYSPLSIDNVIELKNDHIITTLYLHSEMIRYYYYSLKFAIDHDRKLLNSISMTNSKMEEILTTEYMLQALPSSNNLNLHSISNTVH